ncbi:hypothetical protein [uncultured Bacteroides sp.]|uniref:hypothetical protein n=1 Tax=uncultured Bacteroides sp. TaxID=162156 RepID=UPI0026219DC8|nr:hypothetical protein [uncultured Bacteroides sp.]
MRKILLNVKAMMLLLICTFCTVSVYAQDVVTEDKGKPNVYIDYFWRPKEIPFSWVEALRSSVIEGINATNRVELTDVDSKSALAVEKARRESGEVVAGDDMERMKVMTSEGANFLIQGRVSTFETSIYTSDDGKKYWQATCSYTLKVINPADGKLVATKTFKHGDGITNSILEDTEDAAVAKLCSQAIKTVRELVDAAFKMQGVILEIAEEKKDKAEKVYISLGSKHGVAEGAYFSACIERQIAGRTSQKEIGQLKAESVEGEDITLCEVKKGEKEIKAAIDGGQTVVVKTMQKPKSFLDKAGGALNSL